MRSYGKWTALIDSFREYRRRQIDLHENPDVAAVDAEIGRLRDLRRESQRAQKKAERIAQRKAA